MRAHREADHEVVRITGARTALSEDQAARQRRYLFSMSLRTICFVGAILASGPLRWGLIVGAIFLPYVAVVAANIRKSEPRVAMPIVQPLDNSAGAIGPGPVIK